MVSRCEGDRLDFFQFDFRLHRAFDESAKAAARQEVHQTLATLLRENLSLSRLLNSDFVVINGLLADYYCLDGVTADAFRKATPTADSPRGGLLGKAAILAMNVPQLARLDGKLLTARERILAHQEELQCANCHHKIDPIDLAAAFHNGPAFKKHFGLRDLITAKSDDFVRSFTETLIEYALGKHFDSTDEDLAVRIVQKAQQ